MTKIIFLYVIIGLLVCAIRYRTVWPKVKTAFLSKDALALLNIFALDVIGWPWHLKKLITAEQETKE